MIALARMRLHGYLRTGRFLVPLMTIFVIMGILYAGPPSPAGEAYGFSALLMFAIMAWQTKLLLDAEPDVQRRLAYVTVGSATRELSSGLLAGLVAAVPVVVIALVVPWCIGGIDGPQRPEDPSLVSSLAAGAWAHLIVIAPAVLLGAWASRAVTRSFGTGAMVLVGGAVLTIVFGLPGSPLWWAAPPLMSVTRLTIHGFVLAGMAAVSLQALLWTAVAAAGYARIRQARV